MNKKEKNLNKINFNIKKTMADKSLSLSTLHKMRAATGEHALGIIY
jgi:hypothetical protein